MPRRPWRTVALILALLLGAPAVCLAQLGERPERQPHFTRIAVGFSRLVRENRWTPVRILVKNPGKETEV
jgi:hypothetical protein